MKETRSNLKVRRLSDQAKAALSKLSPAELVSIMEEFPAADNNNANNFAMPETKEEMVKKISQLPEGELKNILRAHGIIEK